MMFGLWFSLKVHGLQIGKSQVVSEGKTPWKARTNKSFRVIVFVMVIVGERVEVGERAHLSNNIIGNTQ